MSCCNSKNASRDGTPHIKMSPLEFIRLPAALVPRPRLHPFSRSDGAQRRVAYRDRTRLAAEYKRACGRTRARRAGANALGTVAQARFRYRPQTLPAMWRRLEDHRRERRARRDCQDPHALGLACARATALTGAAAVSLPSGLIREAKTVPQQGQWFRAARTRAKRSNCDEVKRGGSMKDSTNRREREIVH